MSNQITENFLVNDASGKPLVTFALFAYNQEKYIREAIEGAFAQTYSPLEIILSDDCSTDRTFEIIREMACEYRGQHTIILNRNEQNIGITSHVNKIFLMTRGELVVVAAGDDISAPQRTSALVVAWIKHGKPDGVLHSPAITISAQPDLSGLIKAGNGANQDNIDLDWYLHNKTRAPIHGATAAYTNSLFDKYGQLLPGGLIEDRPLVFRALLSGKIIYIDQVLVQYRVSENNVSGRKTIKAPEDWIRWVLFHDQYLRNHLQDYTRDCFIRRVKPEERVVAQLVSIQKDYEKLFGLLSRNPWQILLALWRHPDCETLADRAYFAFHFYQRENTVLYRIIAWGYRSVRELSRLYGTMKIKS